VVDVTNGVGLGLFGQGHQNLGAKTTSLFFDSGF